MTKFMVALAVGVLAGMVSAKDIFVSSDPNWKMPGLEGTTYTVLQDAFNDGGAGDTIWLQDGYVCDSGKFEKSFDNDGGYARGQVQNAAMTVRSESGYVDEAHGKGATIRGAKDPESMYPDGRGKNAIRPLWVTNAKTVIFGLILENGVGGDYSERGGGAAYGGGVYSNCIMRNCTAYAGGAVSGAAALYNCVLTNNYAYGAGYGGGAVRGGASLYGCLVADNHADGMGGAISFSNSSATPTVYSNCVFRHNSAYYTAVANFNKVRGTPVRFYDCDIYDNVATKNYRSGIAGVAYLERCNLWNNVATNQIANLDGGCLSYNVDMYGGNVPIDADMRTVLVDCVVSNNLTGGAGGGGTGFSATNCTFVGNWSRTTGGAAHKSVLVNCDIVGNVATNNESGYGCGGGLSYSTATDCRIINNKALCVYMATGGCGGGALNCNLTNCVVTNNYARYRGAAVHNVATGLACYNCLFADNRSGVTEAVGYDYGMIIEGRGSGTRSSDPPKFYNCTIVDNRTGLYAAIDEAKLYNCIVWGNVAPGGEFYNLGTAKSPSYTVTAEYTCQKNLTAGVDGNVNTDPKLTADRHLGSLRRCVDRGLEYDWMTDPADGRSRDLDGRPRLTRKAPDLGCYELGHPGAVLRLR